MKFAWSWMQEPVRLRQIAFAADDLSKAEDTLVSKFGIIFGGAWRLP